LQACAELAVVAGRIAPLGAVRHKLRDRHAHRDAALAAAAGGAVEVLAAAAEADLLQPLGALAVDAGQRVDEQRAGRRPSM
jgi:hypothetical protein